MDFISEPLKVLLENLVSLGVREGESLFNADENLKKLERTCLRVQAFVQEAKENYNQVMGDEAYKAWLRDLEDAAYDAEDLLDEIAIELSLRPEENRSNNNQVRNLVLSSLKLTAPRNIEKILNRMNNLVKEMASYSALGTIVPAGMKVITDENILQTCSLMDEHPIFGREEDASKIVRMLIGEDEPEGDNVSIVPIVGMAGVGKTTLAKFVYNDRGVSGHFDSKIWLSVSSSFNVERIMRNILAATSNDEESCNQFIALDRLIQVKLANRLSGKKLLLVLDGLLDVNQGELELLLNVLRISATEGVILITTRSHATFSAVCEKNTYYLKPLPDEDCWALLAEKTLKHIVADEAKNLVSIGREIAKKCQGLPWAAKILGSIMQARMNENEWMSILESNMWDLPEVPRNVFLRSHHIPTNLKRCFSYCAIFPQDYEFSKDKLVRMWMAEGFIIPEGVRRVEDIGEKYFDNLLSMSIFQYDCRKYKMHNLIQALAQSISGVKCFRLGANEGTQTSYLNIGYARHLAMCCEHNEITTFNTLFRCKGVRTLLLLREYGMCIKEVPFHMFMKWRRLRVLDLSGTHISNLADNLGNLMHLRYLDLSNTHIRWLPETIGKVYKLQTLVLRNCLYFRQLPECTKNLINLRHLELEGSQLTSMPSGIGNLTNLQTLKDFIVSTKGARLSEIKNITGIQGSICIKKLENIVREEETLETVLKNKKFLHRLELQWSDMQDEGVQMEVLERLQPHENLKELRMRKYSGRIFPSWVGSIVYSNLVSFHLLECRNCDILPPLSHLPMLKSLEIAEMLMVQSIDSIFCGNGVRFPSLETLKLKDMPKLKRWDSLRENDMPRLCTLVIDTCPQLTHLSSIHHLASLNELQLIRCYGLSMLPEEGLPSGLHSLIIIDCPLLSGCGMGGEYWHMIENIPHREILI